MDRLSNALTTTFEPSQPPRPGSAESTAAEMLIYDLLGSSVLLAEDWDRLPLAAREQVLRCPDRDKALALLVEKGLLTEYQAARVLAGTTFGLVLGNYRVLDRLGQGGMAVVFRGEHVEMRHLVAVKVLPLAPGQDRRLQTRFTAEMRTVARLRHPNIVAAMDAGRAFSPDPDAPVLWYLVMEYVPGQDLEDYLFAHGPLPVAKACNLIHQIASALGETHKFKLVHRDIKPSNVLVTAEDQAKLLDFGLSRDLGMRMTQPGTVLGTVDFMAPEQARDASTVDIRADIYGLGGTLYWCLTGQLPFPSNGSITECLMRRLTQEPPAVRQARPEIPVELDAVVCRMMALRPEDRYATPQEVMRALLPFLKPPSREGASPLLPARPVPRPSAQGEDAAGAGPRRRRVLIIDDEPSMRELCRVVLEAEGVACEEVTDGAEGLARLRADPCDVVLLDINMPGLGGLEVLRQLREAPPCPHLKVIMFSGQASSDEMAKTLFGGADDYLPKPFNVLQLQGRVLAALRLKEAQDRSDSLNRQLMAVNAALEDELHSRDSHLVEARNALVQALARLVERRESAGSGHTQRMGRYCRCLATAAARVPPLSDQLDDAFIEMLACCAALHDIGKVGLPDHLLLKPGQLMTDERILMQAHTVIGAEMLEDVAKQHATSGAFLQMARDIVRHHHERFDGTGYPDRLAGSAIPLAARIVSICDVYDALRSRRSYKPALSHAAALQMMTEASPGQFDPALLAVFLRCAPEFERIFQDVPN